jgi:hypothetical protein
MHKRKSLTYLALFLSLAFILSACAQATLTPQATTMTW